MVMMMMMMVIGVDIVDCVNEIGLIRGQGLGNTCGVIAIGVWWCDYPLIDRCTSAIHSALAVETLGPDRRET